MLAEEGQERSRYGVQLVEDGPEIPLSLLRAQQSGDLVFFCGAGLSKEVGLPTFAEFVASLSERLVASDDERLREIIKKENSEEAIRYLSTRFERSTIVSAARQLLMDVETTAPTSHEAILKLSRDDAGATRIVTTNFDNQFEIASASVSGVRQPLSAPGLPVPKKEKWRELVYLHGRFDTDRQEGYADDAIVLTPADFGAAYLHEGWAARFISELFRNFVVVFVGYGVDDVVLRYLIDAIAADRVRDPTRAKEVFAFANFDSSSTDWTKDVVQARWEQRGVSPILYDTASHGFVPLHQTLLKWAALADEGVAANARFIRKFADKPPNALVASERSLFYWSVLDNSRAPLLALRSPENDEHPLFLHPDWLESHEGGTARSPIYEAIVGLRNSVDRASHEPEYAALVSSAKYYASSLRLSDVQISLAHLILGTLRTREHSETIARKIASLGGRLHPDLAELIREELDSDRIQEESECRFWRALTGLLPFANETSSDSIFDTARRIRAMVLAEAEKEPNRSEYKQLLSRITQLLQPRFSLERASAFRSVARSTDSSLPKSVREIAGFEVHIGHPHFNKELLSALLELKDSRWILTRLSEEVTNIMRRALEFLELVDHADQRQDFGTIYRPTIVKARSHVDSGLWSFAVDVLVAFLNEFEQESPPRGRPLVATWTFIPFPVFRRLAIHAAAEHDLQTCAQMLDHFSSDPDEWIWSGSTQGELLSYLPEFWEQLFDDERDSFRDLLLTGPSDAFFRDDLTKEDKEVATDELTWRRIQRLSEDEASLPNWAVTLLAEIEERQPHLKGISSAPVDPEELEATWIESKSSFTDEELLDMSPSELVSLCPEKGGMQAGLSGQLRGLSRVRTSWACAVIEELVNSELQKDPLWDAVLGGLGEAQEILEPSKLIDLLASVDDAIIRSYSFSIAGILETTAKTKFRSETWLKLWDSVKSSLSVEEQQTGDFDAFTLALNGIVGKLTQALLDSLTTRPEDREIGVPLKVRDRISWCISEDNSDNLQAAAMVGSRLYLLFWLDPEWTTEIALPIFDPKNPSLAAAAWQGFFYNAHVTPSLWLILKPHLLATADCGLDLGQIGDEGLPSFLVSLILDGDDALSFEESRGLLKALNSRQMSSVAWSIWKRLTDAGDRAAAMWKERIYQWLSSCWPKTIGSTDSSTSEYLAVAALASGSELDAATRLVAGLLSIVEHPILLFSSIEEHLSAETADDVTANAVVRIIDAITPAEIGFSHQEVCSFLEPLLNLNPTLKDDQRWQRLFRECARKGL